MSATGSDTTVWELAAATDQPLEVVIFQTVAYGGWTEGGVISADWAATITGVLHGAHPSKRRTHFKSLEAQPEAGDDGAVGSDDAAGIGDVDLVAAFATRVVANLGNPVKVTAMDPAAALSSLGLGELRREGFAGYPDEAPVWAQLAAGELSVEDLENR